MGPTLRLLDVPCGSRFLAIFVCRLKRETLLREQEDLKCRASRPLVASRDQPLSGEGRGPNDPYTLKIGVPVGKDLNPCSAAGGQESVLVGRTHVSESEWSKGE